MTTSKKLKVRIPRNEASLQNPGSVPLREDTPDSQKAGTTLWQCQLRQTFAASSPLLSSFHSTDTLRESETDEK